MAGCTSTLHLLEQSEVPASQPALSLLLLVRLRHTPQSNSSSLTHLPLPLRGFATLASPLQGITTRPVMSTTFSSVPENYQPYGKCHLPSTSLPEITMATANEMAPRSVRSWYATARRSARRCATAAGAERDVQPFQITQLGILVGFGEWRGYSRA